MDANMEDWLSAALASARIGGSVLLSLLGNAILVPVVLFYLLMDWPTLVARVQALIPRRQVASVIAFLEECDILLGQYLRGQLLVMLVLAAYYAVGLALFGFDLALPVGVFTGLAIFIPYIGFGLGLVQALQGAVVPLVQLPGRADRHGVPDGHRWLAQVQADVGVSGRRAVRRGRNGNARQHLGQADTR
jgi:predicted PurR-regulated permease PerM